MLLLRLCYYWVWERVWGCRTCGHRAKCSNRCEGTSTKSKAPRVPDKCWKVVRDSSECNAWPGRGGRGGEGG